MKVFGLMVLAFSMLTQVSFAQESMYKISYQDRGPVITHKTCRLVIHPEDQGRVDFEKNLITFLTLKGYRPYLSKKEPFETGLFRDENTQYGDLVMNVKTNYLNHRENKFTLEGELGYIGQEILSKRMIHPIPISEVKPITSKKTKISYFLYSSPLTYKMMDRKIERALMQIFNEIPDCISTGSGHHYESEKYSENIVLHEFRTCQTLYGQELYRIAILKNNALLGTASFLGYGTIFGGLISGGGLLPVGLGLLAVNYSFKIPANIKRNKIKQSMQLISNLESCYLGSLEGKTCRDEDLLKKLNASSQSRIKKYLEHTTADALVLSLADYMGTQKICSEDAKKIHKVTLKRMLKEVGKTL